MPRTSKQSASRVQSFPLAEDRSEDLDGFTVSFVTIHQTHDLTQMLSGLPGGQCPCPHWGYLTKGRLTIDYGDQQETVEAGDAFYMPPGHVPGAEAGSEFLMISPADQFASMMAAVAASGTMSQEA